ncbi:MAG: hypothetical protein H7123_00550 [Thermoleophilia bacterium]|nr:hypothetical protein [Thermoleophilia bacterium]
MPTMQLSATAQQSASATQAMDGMSMGMMMDMPSTPVLGAKAVDITNRNGSTTTLSNGKGDTKTMFARPVVEDRTKAAGVINTLVNSTAKYADTSVAQAAGYDFTALPIEGDILHVPNKSFSKQFGGTDLQHPGMLLYRKTGNQLTLIGTVLTATRTAPDLGMGQWHVHNDHVELMKHVWLEPDNLDQAFSESAPPR